jgi:hypothetical protein
MKDKLTPDLYYKYIKPLVDNCDEKECKKYWLKIREVNREQQNETILELFEAVCSYLLVPDFPDKFKPFCVMNTKRSPMPSDLTIEQRDFLEQILPQIEDSELRARVSDTLWSLKHGKKREHAELAIEAYIAASDKFSEKFWLCKYNRLARAFSIFLNVKFVRNEVPVEKDAHKKILDTIKVTNHSILVTSLIKLLIEKNKADDSHAIVLEDIAVAQEGNNQFKEARDAWGLAGKLYKKAKKTDDEIRCQENAAKTYVKLADIEEYGPCRSMKICSLLQSALEEYRNISGKKQQVFDINARLVQCQLKIKSEMQSFEKEIDISFYMKQAIEKVSRRDIASALSEFLCLLRPLKIEEIQKELEKQAKQSPLSTLVSTTYHNQKGHVVDSYSPDDSQEKKMHRHVAQVYRRFHAKSALEPALHQISLEHNISLDDWVALLKSSPFVPTERVNAYAYGFLHGFQGDFFSAAHILIPQIENSIRYVLNNYGRQTSRQTDGIIQEESPLNHTLEQPELVEIFGKDVVFDLQGLLIKKEGNNLRNKLMHGLLDDAQMVSGELAYLYWLALYIICVMPKKN